MSSQVASLFENAAVMSASGLVLNAHTSKHGERSTMERRYPSGVSGYTTSVNPSASNPPAAGAGSGLVAFAPSTFATVSKNSASSPRRARPSEGAGTAPEAYAATPAIANKPTGTACDDIPGFGARAPLRFSRGLSSPAMTLEFMSGGAGEASARSRVCSAGPPRVHEVSGRPRDSASVHVQTHRLRSSSVTGRTRGVDDES